MTYILAWIVCGLIGMALDLVVRRRTYLDAAEDTWAIGGIAIGMLVGILCGPLQLFGVYVIWRRLRAHAPGHPDSD